MHIVKVKSRSGHSAHLPQSLKLLMLPWPLEVSTGTLIWNWGPRLQILQLFMYDSAILLLTVRLPTPSKNVPLVLVIYHIKSLVLSHFKLNPNLNNTSYPLAEDLFNF